MFSVFWAPSPAARAWGLSISRSIVEAHGGRLEAARENSAPGARFQFTVPVVLVNADA
jgi:signal transduction histidine kinase